MGIKKLIALSFFLLLSQFTVAAPETRVFGMDRNGLFDVGRYYGDRINYYINWIGNHDITVNTGGGTSVVSISSNEVINGFDVWNSRLRNNFHRESNDSQNHNILVRIVSTPSSPSSAGYTSFNSTTTTRNGQTIININSYFFANSAWASFQNSIRRGFIDNDTTFDDYVRIMVRLTIVHEIGHALGLMHPGETRLASQIVPRSYLRQLPSIMYPDVTGYFNSLHEHIGRAITLGDILPSSNDIMGANIMLNGTPQALSRVAYFFAGCLHMALNSCIKRTEL